MFIINIVPTAIMYNTLFYMKTTIKTIYISTAIYIIAIIQFKYNTTV